MLAEPQFNQFRQRSIVLAFDIKETPDGLFEYRTVTVPPGQFTRDGIVNLLISEEYPDDVMWSIVNNYLADPKGKEHLSDFKEMQAWRSRAKEIAEEALGAL